jgi:hypothetical protein
MDGGQSLSGSSRRNCIHRYLQGLVFKVATREPVLLRYWWRRYDGMDFFFEEEVLKGRFSGVMLISINTGLLVTKCTH